MVSQRSIFGFHRIHARDTEVIVSLVVLYRHLVAYLESACAQVHWSDGNTHTRCHWLILETSVWILSKTPADWRAWDHVRQLLNDARGLSTTMQLRTRCTALELCDTLTITIVRHPCDCAITTIADARTGTNERPAFFKIERSRALDGTVGWYGGHARRLGPAGGPEHSHCKTIGNQDTWRRRQRF